MANCKYFFHLHIKLTFFYEMCKKYTALSAGSELVGLVPLQAMLAAAQFYMDQDHRINIK